jgi:hypothetical protein
VAAIVHWSWRRLCIVGSSELSASKASDHD